MVRRTAIASAAVAVVLLVALGVTLAMKHSGRDTKSATSANPSVLSSALASQSASPSQKPAHAVPAYDPALHNCGAQPHVCGYPDATNTGVPAGTHLLSVPGQISHGPGWYYDTGGWVEVDGNGAVLQGLSIPYNVDVTGSNVTIKDVKVIATADDFGVSLRHTHNVTVEDSDIYSTSAGANLLTVGVKDIYGDATGTRVLGNNIWHTSTGVQIYTGLIEGNYIHDMGYADGDHLNGITTNGGIDALTIEHNTVFNSFGQTDAISVFEDFGVEANVLISGNLVAGGGYTVYGGQNPGGPQAYNIRIVNNRFSTIYYSQAGYYGPVSDFDPGAPGNVWSGNIWDTTGESISS
jgi:phage baseplate assembly protein gpV